MIARGLLTICLLAALPATQLRAGPSAAARAGALGDAAFLRSKAAPVPAAGKVRIVRDKWGVPHVYAAREVDGFYGVGYALAADNLVNILKAYMGGQGRLAEVEGETFLQSDVMARHWKHAEVSRIAYARLPADVRAHYDAYVAGVERYMAEHPAEVPAWWSGRIEPWMPMSLTHTLLLIAVWQSQSGYNDCRRGGANGIVPPILRVERQTYPDTLPASNQWAVAPSRSRTGQAMLLADSHSDFAAPRDEIRIHAGGLNSSGVVFAGTFLPIIGRSANVAWAFDNGGPDSSDCYRIEVENDPTEYRVDGESRRIRQQIEEFKVKDGATVRRTLEWATINGVEAPVVARNGRTAFAVASAYMGIPDVMDKTIYGMNTARDVSEFKTALAHFGMFPENIMFGDDRGNISYVQIGRVPRRSQKYQWNQAVPGNTRQTEWQGLHPYSELITIDNPPGGVMYNMNTAPETNTPDGKAIDPGRYPRYVHNDTPGRNNERSLRGRDLVLALPDKITLDDLWKLGTDEGWYYTSAWQKALTRAVGGPSAGARALSADARMLLRSIQGFKGVATIDSVPAAHMWAWRASMGEASGQRIDLEKLERDVRAGTILDAGQTAAMLAALNTAAADLRRYHGRIAIRLGDLIKFGRSGRAFPVGGPSIYTGSENAEETLRTNYCAPVTLSAPCMLIEGQRHPVLTLFSKPLKSFTSVPYGQSADPSSPHHLDQATLYTGKALKPDYFEWADLRGAAVSGLELATNLE